MKQVTVKTLHRVIQEPYPDTNLYITHVHKHGATDIRSVISKTKIKAGLRTKVIEYRSNRLEYTIPEDTGFSVSVSNQAITVTLEDRLVKIFHTRFVVVDLKVKAQLILLGIRQVRVFSTDLSDHVTIAVDILNDRSHLKYSYIIDPTLEINIDLVTQALKLKGIMT